MTVSEIMTEDVIWTPPDSRIKDVAELMLHQCVTGLPVMTLWRGLVGIVTEGDLLRRSQIKSKKGQVNWLKFMAAGGHLSGEFEHFAARSVAEVMTPNVIVATESLVLEAAVELMDHNHVKRLPVVRDGNVVGILTRSNLIRALLATRTTVQGPEDHTIREMLKRAVREQPSRPHLFHLVVRDGVVYFWGMISDEHQRAAVHNAIKQVPGIRDVRDGLVWHRPRLDGVDESAISSIVPPGWIR